MPTNTSTTPATLCKITLPAAASHSERSINWLVSNANVRERGERPHEADQDDRAGGRGDDVPPVGQGPDEAEQQAAQGVDRQRAPGELIRMQPLHDAGEKVTRQRPRGTGDAEQQELLPEWVFWGHPYLTFKAHGCEAY